MFLSDKLISTSQEIDSEEHLRNDLAYFMSSGMYKNSSGDEIANVNFYAVRLQATRIR